MESRSRNAGERNWAGSDHAVKLSLEAAAFRQIKLWTTQGDLEIESALLALFKASRVSDRIACFGLYPEAARILSFLTEGSVPFGHGSAACPTTVLKPAFYASSLGCYFERFDPVLDENCCLELMIHAATLLDAHEAFTLLSDGKNETTENAVLDFLCKNGLLSCSKLLPDNSSISWEKFASNARLVPNFEALLQLLLDNEAHPPNARQSPR
jgi:hypothetical protein